MKNKEIEISEDDINNLINIVISPKWQFWNTKKKRTRAHETLVRTGKQAVPLLISVNKSDKIKYIQKREIASILSEMGTSVIPLVLSQAVKASGYLEVSSFCHIFEAMGSNASAAIPLLLKWTGCKVDPKLDHFRHLTGNKELDEALWSHVWSRISSSKKASIKFYEEISSAWTRQEAAQVLANLGTSLKPYLSQLKQQLKLEKDKYAKIYIQNAIDAAEQ